MYGSETVQLNIFVQSLLGSIFVFIYFFYSQWHVFSNMEFMALEERSSTDCDPVKSSLTNDCCVVDDNGVWNTKILDFDPVLSTYKVNLAEFS